MFLKYVLVVNSANPSRNLRVSAKHHYRILAVFYALRGVNFQVKDVPFVKYLLILADFCPSQRYIHSLQLVSKSFEIWY